MMFSRDKVGQDTNVKQDFPKISFPWLPQFVQLELCGSASVSSHLFELCELTRLGNFIFLSIFVADKYIGNTHTLHVMQLDRADIAPHCVLWGW